jgi:hypothetical protein
MDSPEANVEGVAESGGTSVPRGPTVMSLPSSHKDVKSYDEYPFVIEGSGTVVATHLKQKIHQKRKGGGARNGVTFFSKQSRQRFMLKTARICWDSVPKSRCFYLRVTFLPPQGSLARPKRSLAMFWERLRAFLGSRGYSVVWKQEYMRSGDWHVHMLLVVWRMPRSLANRDHVELDAKLPADFARVLAEWTARTWGRALGWKGQQCPKDATWCEKVRSVRRVVGYSMKGPSVHSAKWYATKVPDGAKPDGRWWGVIGARLPENHQEQGISATEFYGVRRLLVKAVESRSRGACHLPIWSRWSPVTAVAGTCDGALYDSIRAYVESSRNASQRVTPAQDAEELSEVAA